MMPSLSKISRSVTAHYDRSYKPQPKLLLQRFVSTLCMNGQQWYHDILTPKTKEREKIGERGKKWEIVKNELAFIGKMQT